MYSERLKNFTKLYDEISYKYGGSNIFIDFTKMCAISIYNSFAKNQEMEQEYLQVINSYEKKDQEIFPKMFSEIIMMYEETEEITDILGQFYEKEHLGNKHLGQFFTPTHISDFMAEIAISDENTLKEIIKEKGFITMNEPTCGAGRYDNIFCKSFKNTQYKLSTKLISRSSRHFCCMCLYDIYTISIIWNTSCCILWRYIIRKNAF